MCGDDLVELCASEFGDLIDEIYYNNRMNGSALLRAPIIDRLYST